MAPKKKLLIHELARKAGITTRTVRYYASLGLLPEPEQHGRYSHYTQEHLDRLELIRQLKEKFLPLREIRQVIGHLSHQEVQQLLRLQKADSQEPEKEDDSAPDILDQRSNAKEYIANLISEQPSLPIPSAPSKSFYQIPPSALREPKLSARPGETWRRMDIAPGIELHMREPLSPEDDGKLQTLVRYIRTLFGNE